MGAASPVPTNADVDKYKNYFLHVSTVVLKLADNIAPGTASGLDVGTVLVSANGKLGETSLVK